ncbi:MAG: BtpA/SgcQ family protein [Aigarchaeota archaeon]|nr:BtpA/SgcQ family protein [Candidatus Pelearchaeum maunauluense]
MNILEEIFGVAKPIIGMVHLKPLHGSPRFRERAYDLFETALKDAEALKEGGVDGVQVENMGDSPFLKPGEIGHEVVALVASVAREVRRATGLPTGVFVLANGVEESIAAAKACGARWVRANMWAYAYIADEGFVEAAAPRAERLKGIDMSVSVFADVLVKHGSHLITSDIPLATQVSRLEELGADAIIASGERTGAETPLERLQRVKSAASRPVLVGSGITPANVERLLTVADGAIVGTYFKVDGVLANPVDARRVREIMRIVERLR